MKIKGPEGPPEDELILMGRVMKGHGIKGEVKLYCETDEPRRFGEIDTLYLGRRPVRTQSYEVENVWLQNHAKKGVIAVMKFGGVEDRTAADQLRGLQVYAHEEELPELEEGEVFLHDLVGLTVETDAGEHVGKVVDVLRLPAHDAFLVHKKEGGEAIVPDVDEFIVELDLEAERLVIAPIEGLLD